MHELDTEQKDLPGNLLHYNITTLRQHNTRWEYTWILLWYKQIQHDLYHTPKRIYICKAMYWTATYTKTVSTEEADFRIHKRKTLKGYIYMFVLKQNWHVQMYSETLIACCNNSSCPYQPFRNPFLQSLAEADMELKESVCQVRRLVSESCTGPVLKTHTCPTPTKFCFRPDPLTLELFLN